MKSLSNRLPARMRPWLLPTLCFLIAGALAAVVVFDVPASKLLLWALVLACPLSHLLMGHGAHGGSREPDHTHPAAPTALSAPEVDTHHTH